MVRRRLSVAKSGLPNGLARLPENDAAVWTAAAALAKWKIMPVPPVGRRLAWLVVPNHHFGLDHFLAQGAADRNAVVTVTHVAGRAGLDELHGRQREPV